jgi:hypothetical protein
MSNFNGDHIINSAKREFESEKPRLSTKDPIKEPLKSLNISTPVERLVDPLNVPSVLHLNQYLGGASQLTSAILEAAEA